MDFDSAIQAHGEWKFKFRNAIHRREQLDAAAISRDNECLLGKWLHGEAKASYSGLKSCETYEREVPTTRILQTTRMSGFAPTRLQVSSFQPPKEASCQAVRRSRTATLRPDKAHAGAKQQTVPRSSPRRA